MEEDAAAPVDSNDGEASVTSPPPPDGPQEKNENDEHASCQIPEFQSFQHSGYFAGVYLPTYPAFDPTIFAAAFSQAFVAAYNQMYAQNAGVGYQQPGMPWQNGK